MTETNIHRQLRFKKKDGKRYLKYLKIFIKQWTIRQFLLNNEQKQYFLSFETNLLLYYFK